MIIRFFKMVAVAIWDFQNLKFLRVGKVKFSGVTILQGVVFFIFLLIFEWALQQCSATALSVINVDEYSHEDVIFLFYRVGLPTEE